MLAVIAIDTGVVESVLTLTPGLRDQRLGQALAQVGAQLAQGGDAGDDAGLFGEGWERHRCFNKNTLIQVDHGGTNRFALQVTP